MDARMPGVESFLESLGTGVGGCVVLFTVMVKGLVSKLSGRLITVVT